MDPTATSIEMLLEAQKLEQERNAWERACDIACRHGGYYLEPKDLYQDAIKELFDEQIETYSPKTGT